MISSSRQAVACILLLWPTIIFAQSQTASDKEPNGTISGKVTVKGNAVSGVVVGLINSQQRFGQAPVKKAVTDDDGIYRITNVKSGAYELAVSSLIYVTAGSGRARKTLVVGNGETIENVDFNLVRGGVITGKVTDSEGRPVIEINVSISPAQFDHRVSLSPSLRTDDRGIYRAFGLSPGSYAVSAGQEEQSIFGPSMTRFEHRLTYHPTATERSEATIIEVTEGSESTGVDITFGRSMIRYFASGRIVDGESGKPLAGVRYGVFKFSKQGFEGSSTGGRTTNEQGEFKLHGLSPGSYAVIAEHDGDIDLRVERHRFEVVDRDVTGLIVKSMKGGTVSGVIVLEGKDSKGTTSVEHAFLTASVASRGGVQGSNRSAMIKSDGTFRVGGLSEGHVRFWVSSRDNLQVIRVERDGVVYPNGIEIQDLEQMTGLRIFVGYANGMVRGIVKLANGSLPPENLVSVILRKSGDDPANGSRGAQVDGRGQFVADRLLPGTYEVTASLYSLNTSGGSDSRFKKATQQVVVTNDNVSTVTLTLPEQ